MIYTASGAYKAFGTYTASGIYTAPSTCTAPGTYTVPGTYTAAPLNAMRVFPIISITAHSPMKLLRSTLRTRRWCHTLLKV